MRATASQDDTQKKGESDDDGVSVYHWAFPLILLGTVSLLARIGRV